MNLAEVRGDGTNHAKDRNSTLSFFTCGSCAAGLLCKCYTKGDLAKGGPFSLKMSLSWFKHYRVIDLHGHCFRRCRSVVQPGPDTKMIVCPRWKNTNSILQYARRYFPFAVGLLPNNPGNSQEVAMSINSSIVKCIRTPYPV